MVIAFLSFCDMTNIETYPRLTWKIVGLWKPRGESMVIKARRYFWFIETNRIISIRRVWRQPHADHWFYNVFSNRAVGTIFWNQIRVLYTRELYTRQGRLQDTFSSEVKKWYFLSQTVFVSKFDLSVKKTEWCYTSDQFNFEAKKGVMRQWNIHKTK